MDGRVGRQGLGSLSHPQDRAHTGQPIPPAAIAALRALRSGGVPACLLRAPGAHDGAGPEEVDILAADDPRLGPVLLSLGFVAVPAPGRGPHRFFLGYDEERGEWLKLDVVVELAYGPHHELPTHAARGCLERARRGDGPGQLDVADELWTLLLHCLLDKGAIRADHAARLHELALAGPSGGALAAEVGPMLPHEWTSDRVVASARAGDWPALVDLGEELRRRWTRGHPVATRLRRLRSKASRRLFRLLAGSRPRGCRVALLGPDGAGKSTVSARLVETVPLPATSVYAGLYPQGSRARRQLPGTGLARKLVRLRSASVRARLLELRGRLVVFDRYPYDAILPTEGRASARSRLRRWLLAHSCSRPQLAIVLDAPAEVLFARSGEHGVEALEGQRRRYRALASRLELPTVDTDVEAEVVLRRVTGLVWNEYVRRAEGGR